MTFEELIQWNRRIRILKPKARKVSDVGKTVAKAALYAVAIAYGLGSPYLLFNPRIDSRGPRYFSRYSLERAKLLPAEDPEEVRKSLYYLKRKRYVAWKLKGNAITLQLTKEGEKRFGRVVFGDIALSKEKQWDGYWRFFIFDIPQKRKAISDMLRDKLKRIGFFRLQKSVWVYPYNCEDEMHFICDYLDINSNVIMFTAKIQNDALLRKYFAKQNFNV